jgi:hypothetical protein
MKYKSEMVKIKKFSHILKIVMNVFYWTSIVSAFGALVAAVVIKIMSDSNFALSEKTIEHLGFSLDGVIKYKLSGVTSQGISTKNIYFTIMSMSILILVIIIAVLRQLIPILRTVEEDKPFAIENAMRISRIGVVSMIASFLIPSGEVITANVIINTLKIQNISTNYSVNLILVLTGFIMFVLGGIFKYGSYLQHEYDETV